MKFLVDAQLPRSLAGLLQSFGHDAMHTLDLLELFRAHLPAIVNAVSAHSFVKIDRSGLTIHA